MDKSKAVEIQIDPILEAKVKADCSTIVIHGYVSKATKETVTIHKTRSIDSFLQIPRNAIVSAHTEENSKTVLLVKADAEILFTRMGLASEFVGQSCGCDGGSDVGVAEARPYKSIHPMLAQLQLAMIALRASVGSGPGAAILKCESNYHDSIVAGKDPDEADIARTACLMGISPGGDPTDILW